MLALLCLYINCDPGLEFHSEVVGKDGDLLDELFYQSFVELCDVCFLLGDKNAECFRFWVDDRKKHRR